MYEFTNTKTGRVYRCKNLKAALRRCAAQDLEYGAICTTYPRYVEVAAH